MIKDLIYNTEAKIKSVDKTALTDKIKNMCCQYEVMFIYFGGSISYNTFNPYSSDIDVTVILKGFYGYLWAYVDGIDLFIYGEDYFKIMMGQKEGASQYASIFIDTLYSLDKTLIYLNEKYEKEYSSFKNFKVELIMKTYLKNVYDYFSQLYTTSERASKKFYHVIRIYGQFQNYLKTGTYNLSMDENYQQLMIEFKNNYNKENGERIYINEIPIYLEEFRKYIEKD